jgi:hypothetical protein
VGVQQAAGQQGERESGLTPRGAGAAHRHLVLLENDACAGLVERPMRARDWLSRQMAGSEVGEGRDAGATER